MDYNTTFPPLEDSENNQGSQRSSGGWGNSQQQDRGQQNSWRDSGQQRGGWNNNRQGGQGQSGWKPRPQDTDLTIYRPYTVILDKAVPENILAKVEEIVKVLSGHGFTLRYGGTEEFESRFEKVAERKELILPWRDFNEKQSKFTFNNDRSLAVAKMFHPTFDTMKKGVQAFLARNARLILGHEMKSPTNFLICWTDDGCESLREKTSATGFVGHPIAIASAAHVPIYNLNRENSVARFQHFMNSLEA